MVKSIYKKIKLLRKENNFSQEYIARELGMSRPTYMQIEKGERELTISEVEKLAAMFGMQLEDLLSSERVSDKKIIFIEEKLKKKSKATGVRVIVNRADIIKFKEALLYILEKVGAKPNIGETAIYKLLYFIDFDFYEKFEEQLTGARYIKNHYGPTPVEFKKIVEEMVDRGEIEKVKSKYFKYDQKKYLPHRSPDLRVLSAQEIKHIDEVLGRFSDKNAGELIRHSHSDVPWRVHKYGEIISYESVFYRDSDHSVREYEDEL